MKISAILELEESNVDGLEEILCENLNNVDFIGQLEIDETIYNYFMKLLRNNYFEGAIKGGHIPPATFLTSMVFCARYSSDDSRKFWEPYGKFWRRTPDNNFQRWCRDHFNKSIQDLSHRFGFDFPQRTSGDVVRSVYYHALIPAHLKDDFVRWLNQMLPDFMRMDTEQITNDLKDRTHYIAPTLQTFILSEDTQPAAIALITEMMDAVHLYQDGESPLEIHAYLNSIIEKDIWEQLIPNLQAEDLKVKRVLKPKIEWVWDLESDQLLIRVRDIISPPESKPYQFVIRESGQSIEDSNRRERVYPGKTPDGNWYIDEHIFYLTDKEVNYLISIVDIEDNNLLSSFRLSVPPLPQADIIFWRITQQGVYAIPVPDASTYLDGEWIVLLKENASIHTNLQDFQKPDLLDSEYDSALRGDIRFPVCVHYADGTEKELKPKYSSVVQATLQGQKIEFISPKVPPVFISSHIYLKLYSPEEQIKRFKFQIEKDGRIIKQLRLSQIKIYKNTDHFLIDLEPYLYNFTGKFTINLLRGSLSVLSNPIQFSILPNINILQFPDPDYVYHASDLPRVLIDNKSLSPEIEFNENSVVLEEVPDNNILITWTDLQNNLCNIVIDGVPLAWEIKRIYAWIEHKELENIDDIRDLSHSWLHIRGLRYQTVTLKVNDDGYDRELDARGHFSTQIERDRIGDIIKSEASGSIRLGIYSDYGSWVLWERLENITIEYTEINYDVFKQTLSVNIDLSYPLSGRFEYRIISADKQNLSGYQNTLQPLNNLRLIIPILLHPARYQILLLYNGSVLADSNETSFFTVPHIIDSLITENNTLSGYQKLKLLTLKHSDFDKFDDEKLKDYWIILKYISYIRNTDELLPAWAVTENALTCNIIFAGGVKQLILYPEKSLNRGKSGIGKTPLNTNDGWKYAYVEWDNIGKYSSEIRLRLPEEFPSTSTFSDLDPDDMYPIYYSRRYLEFYVKQGYPTQQEVRDQDLIEVSNDHSLPCEINLNERLLQSSLKPHYVVDRRYLIARLEYDENYHINKEHAKDYRSAIDNFFVLEYNRTTRKEVLKFIASDSKYRIMLEIFSDTLESNPKLSGVRLSQVTKRFIRSALLWPDNKDCDYCNIDRLVVLLALALRLKAHYPHLHKDIDSLIPEKDLIDMITLVECFAPDLFIWSLTWVERFAIHAIS